MEVVTHRTFPGKAEEPTNSTTSCPNASLPSVSAPTGITGRLKTMVKGVFSLPIPMEEEESGGGNIPVTSRVGGSPVNFGMAWVKVERAATINANTPRENRTFACFMPSIASSKRGSTKKTRLGLRCPQQYFRHKYDSLWFEFGWRFGGTRQGLNTVTSTR